jgi:hypothetical protein
VVELLELLTTLKELRERLPADAPPAKVAQIDAQIRNVGKLLQSA